MTYADRELINILIFGRSVLLGLLALFLASGLERLTKDELKQKILFFLCGTAFGALLCWL